MDTRYWLGFLRGARTLTTFASLERVARSQICTAKTPASGVVALLAAAPDEAVQFAEELGIVVRTARAGPGAGGNRMLLRRQFGVHGQRPACRVPTKGSLRSRARKTG